MNRGMLVKGLLIIIIASFLVWLNSEYLQYSPEEIQDWILSFGWLAPVLYVIIFIVRPVVLLPISLFSLAGGLAFGTFYGTILTVVGATGGAAVSFIIARKLGKNLINRKYGGIAGNIQQQLEKNGLFYIIILRLIPLLNFDIISYSAGISRIKPQAFLLGTLLGMAPLTVVYSYLGSSFIEGNWLKISLIVVLIVIISVSLFVFGKKWKQIAAQ